MLFFNNRYGFFILVILSIFFIICLSKLDKIEANFQFIYSDRTQKIFCFILTTSNGFKNERAQTVLSVWAQKCDGYKFVTLNYSLNLNSNLYSSNSDVYFKPENLLLHPYDLKNDTYSKLTDKVFKTIIKIYKQNYDYDWYLKADDDTFIEVNNLRNFLINKDPKEPITYGHNFRIIVNGGYNSGGAGYILSKEALNILGNQLVKNYSYCENTGLEDVDVGNCLRKLNVSMGISLDKNGKNRFFPSPLLEMVEKDTGWLKSYSQSPPEKGVECCSDTFISFHKLKPKDMTRLDIVLYNLNRNKNNYSFQDVYLNYKYLKDLEEAMSQVK